MARPGRPAVVAAAFGLAAAFASWHPLAAPFGLVVGLAAVVLSARALKGGAGRPFAAAGLAMAILAVGASALVLALTAGVGRDPTGEPVVAGPSRDEAQRTLDQAAEATQEARERARRELGGASGTPAPPAP
ncbi:MAG: hypothetical protein QM767_17520 [Anaeromyxobacter sp.]